MPDEIIDGVIWRGGRTPVGKRYSCPDKETADQWREEDKTAYEDADAKPKPAGTAGASAAAE